MGSTRKVLLTGGTGVIGNGLIPALLDAGHHVRLLTRHADRDAEAWPEDVEPFTADIAEPGTLDGAADDCDAVVHVAGIAEESPPATYERINVQGTRNILREAARAHVGRFLFLSSLGADTGRSAYHRSKRDAEQLVAAYPAAWTILRPGAVYGPGDTVVSSLMVLVRSLPAVPVLGDGDQRFQPIWYEDLGAAITRALERDDLDGRTLELAGDEVTTTNDLLDRLQRLEGRSTPRVPVPTALASMGIDLAEGTPLMDLVDRVTGIDLPIDATRLQMLQEENFIGEGSGNDLTRTLRVTPLPLDEGLRRLAEELPERLPDQGMGPLRRSRFWTVIRGSTLDADELMSAFRYEAPELLPIAFVNGAGQRPIRAGDTLELHLPGRGNVAVRAEATGERHVTLATVEGHPLAGVVRFETAPSDDGVRFTIEVHARAAGAYDFLLMRAAGDDMQRSTWAEAVLRVAERSGGTAPGGVLEDHTDLDGDTARAAERWIRRVVEGRRAAENARDQDPD